LKEVLLMISVDRAKKIIQCYGGHSQSWPEQERKEILPLLLDSKRLTDMQQEAIVLDNFFGLNNLEADDLNGRQRNQLCADRILTTLPEQQRKIEQITVQFLPEINVIRKKIRSSVPVLLVAVMVMSVLSLSNNLQLNQSREGNKYLTVAEYMAVYVEDNYMAEEESMPINNEQLEILAFLEPQIMDENN